MNEYSVRRAVLHVFGAEGEVEGPYGLSDHNLVHSGMIGPDTLFVRAETEEWLALSSD